MRDAYRRISVERRKILNTPSTSPTENNADPIMIETIAYFEDIQSHLIDELVKAQSEIVIAVPWLTDRKLFDLICSQSRKGIRVQLLLMQDDINRSCRIPFHVLEASGGELYWAPDNGRLMHNKFVVIDLKTVIIGSYNWSKKAQTNDENITVITGNLELASQYFKTHQKILRDLGYHSSLKLGLDPRSISLRLQTIRNLIELDEMEAITDQVRKLVEYELESDLQEIIRSISDRLFDQARVQINQYLGSHQQIVEYVDPEIAQLELLLQALELQLNALSDQKTEMERQIVIFDLRTTVELGEFINEYLRLRSEKLRRVTESERLVDKEEEEEEEVEAAKAEYQQAKQEYEEYRREYEIVKDAPSFQLDEEEQKRLKTQYRKASQKCHPDKVDEAHQEEAQKVFVALNAAYRKNDIQTVESILKKIEHNQFDFHVHKIISDRALIEERISELCRTIELITRELVMISKSENYRQASSISDHDAYFETQRARLKKNIEQLRAEIEEEILL